MAKHDYQSAVRALVNAGDITTFSPLIGATMAPVKHVAKAAGMTPLRFNSIMKKGLRFSDTEIAGMAEHFGIAVTKMKALIVNDPLYPKKEEDQQ